MNALLQPHNRAAAAGGLNQPLRLLAGLVSATPLGRIMPTTPAGRRAFNLLLLGGVVTPLFLALALVSVFRPWAPSASPVEMTSAQAIGALDRVMEQHARTVASMSVDSVIQDAGRQQETTFRRLTDFLAVYPEFEAFAIVDSQGAVTASAGNLPVAFSGWREVPAFQNSLEHPESPAVSSLLPGGSPAWETRGSVLDAGRSHRMVFAAALGESGDPARAGGVLVGVMRTETLLDSVQVMLYGDAAQHRSTGGPEADLGYPTTEMPGPRQSVRQLLDNYNLAVTGAALALVILAGGIVFRSGRAAGITEDAPLQTRPLLSSVTPWFGDPPGETSRRLVAVQEAVRREMADYLHGHVQSKLLALSLSLGMCRQALERDPLGASQMLERVQTELQKVQDEDLRQVSRELYPAIIKFGLAPAMRSLVGRFNESVEIDLNIDPAVASLDLAGEAGMPEKQRLGIYRIAEEALNNVLKHAAASRVRVSLDWHEPELLVLSVVDNGRGFDLHHRPSSHGLMMITDYAEAIGAKAEVVSFPGRGTTVRLALSLGCWEMAVPLQTRVN